MLKIDFTWDGKKNLINQKKHHISFDEAKTVFYDENALLIADTEHSISEDRFIILGASIKLNILLVCHCYLEDNKIIRIISARRASKRERKQYGERLI